MIGNFTLTLRSIYMNLLKKEREETKSPSSQGGDLGKIQSVFLFVISQKYTRRQDISLKRINMFGRVSPTRSHPVRVGNKPPPEPLHAVLVSLEQLPPLGLRPLFEDFFAFDRPPEAVMIEGGAEDEDIY